MGQRLGSFFGGPGPSEAHTADSGPPPESLPSAKSGSEDLVSEPSAPPRVPESPPLPDGPPPELNLIASGAHEQPDDVEMEPTGVAEAPFEARASEDLPDGETQADHTKGASDDAEPSPPPVGDASGTPMPVDEVVDLDVEESEPPVAREQERSAGHSGRSREPGSRDRERAERRNYERLSERDRDNERRRDRDREQRTSDRNRTSERQRDGNDRSSYNYGSSSGGRRDDRRAEYSSQRTSDRDSRTYRNNDCDDDRRDKSRSRQRYRNSDRGESRRSRSRRRQY